MIRPPRTTASASPSAGATPGTSWKGSTNSRYDQPTVSPAARGGPAAKRWCCAKRAAAHAAICRVAGHPQRRSRDLRCGRRGRRVEVGAHHLRVVGVPHRGRHLPPALAHHGVGGEEGQHSREVVGVPGGGVRLGHADGLRGRRGGPWAALRPGASSATASARTGSALRSAATGPLGHAAGTPLPAQCRGRRSPPNGGGRGRHEVPSRRLRRRRYSPTPGRRLPEDLLAPALGPAVGSAAEALSPLPRPPGVVLWRSPPHGGAALVDASRPAPGGGASSSRRAARWRPQHGAQPAQGDGGCARAVPDRPQRELRELTRYRTSLVRERTAEANRLQKTLEGANIKLAAVASDILGVVRTGDARGAGRPGRRTRAALAELARGGCGRSCRSWSGRWPGALDRTSASWWRSSWPTSISSMPPSSGSAPRSPSGCARSRRPSSAAGRHPRGGPPHGRGAGGEVGTDMGRFPRPATSPPGRGCVPATTRAPASAPAARRRKGSRGCARPWWRRRTPPAGRRPTYLAAQYRRLVARRGEEGGGGGGAPHPDHRLPPAHPAQPYQDLGATYLEGRDRERAQRHLVQRLETLGFRVTLETVASP